MDKFYIITNQSKDRALETTHRIQKYIEGRGRECILASDGKSVPKDADCVLVLGGDGTLIRAAREIRSCSVPLLGINLGTLGYLAEVEVNHIEEAVDQLLENSSSVEARMMLKGSIHEKEEDIALNDIVVTRFGELRIIHFNIYVNNELLNSYQADGVIISTPTGSTGYNLSAGGPIVEPTASMIVITPICSHALNSRSIVLSAEDEIIVEIGKGRDNRIEKAEISFDGDKTIEVHTGDRITIQKAENTIKFVKLSKISFLETLRRKMKGS